MFHDFKQLFAAIENHVFISRNKIFFPVGITHNPAKAAAAFRDHTEQVVFRVRIIRVTVKVCFIGRINRLLHKKIISVTLQCGKFLFDKFYKRIGVLFVFNPE